MLIMFLFLWYFPWSGYWKTEDEGVGMAGLVAGDADAHPYVSFTINLVWAHPETSPVLFQGQEGFLCTLGSCSILFYLFLYI